MSGIAASYISSTSFSVTGDQTSDFNTGRRCRSTCSGIYGYTTVVNSSYISPTTTVTITDGIINEGLTIAYYGVSADAAGSMPTHTHDGTEGEGGEITFVALSDTPDVYDDDKYLRSTTSGTEWVSAVGGVTNHSELNELDYASAGHTGFAPTSHSHTESDISDLDKYTESEVDTISGTLQTDIDTKLENIIEDIDPELGGDLSCNNYNIENVGRICGNSLSSKIYNNTGSTLIKGTAVTICGLNEEVCTVCVSDNREIEKMPCCGVVDADIADGAEGCGIRVGRINMDTSGMTGSAKDRLYVQSDGSLDTVIPTSGMVQRVGLLVVKASGSAGRICVCIRGPRSMYSAKDQHPIVRMGGDAGHQKVVFRDYNDNKIAGLDNNGNLTISGTVDGVDVATFKSDYDVHKHDDKYYTESEVDTISGSLQTDINTKLENIIEDTTPELGGQLGVGEHDIKLDALLSADGKYSGITRDGVLGETVGFGTLVYLKSDRKWWKADADAETTSGDTQLAITLVNGIADETKLLMRKGFVRDDSWAFTSYGKEIYVSTTAGNMTQTAPGSGKIVRVVAYASTVSGGYQIEFDPSKTWIELS